jgi:hypothetical protein
MGPVFEWRGLVLLVCAVGSAGPACAPCCLQVSAASLLLFACGIAVRSVAVHCVLDACRCGADVCCVTSMCTF